MGIVGVIALTAILYGIFSGGEDTVEAMELVDNSEPASEPIPVLPPVVEEPDIEKTPSDNPILPEPKKPIAENKPIVPKVQTEPRTPSQNNYNSAPTTTTQPVKSYTAPTVTQPKSIESVTTYTPPPKPYKPIVKPEPTTSPAPSIYTPPKPTPEELEKEKLAREKAAEEERLEREKDATAKAEKERLERENERLELEKARLEREKIATAKAEKEKLERENKLKAEAERVRLATQKRNKENNITTSLKAIVRNKTLGEDYNKIINIATDDTPISIIRNGSTKSNTLHKYCQDIAIRELQKNINKVEIIEENNTVTHITIYEN